MKNLFLILSLLFLGSCAINKNSVSNSSLAILGSGQSQYFSQLVTVEKVTVQVSNKDEAISKMKHLAEENNIDVIKLIKVTGDAEKYNNILSAEGLKSQMYAVDFELCKFNGSQDVLSQLKKSYDPEYWRNKWSF